MYVIDTDGIPLNAEQIFIIMPVTTELMETINKGDMVRFERTCVGIQFINRSFVDITHGIDLTDEEIKKAAVALAEFLCDSKRTYPIYMEAILDAVRKKLPLPSEIDAKYLKETWFQDPVDDALPKRV